MYEWSKFVVTTLVLPPGGPIVLVMLGLLALRKHPRMGRGLAFGGALLLWLLSMPVVAGVLVMLIGGARPLDMAEAPKADAIVILGGGVRPNALEYGGDTLGRLTLERVRYGAWLARQTGLPVLATGGAPKEGVRAEADLMREALEREYGVPVRWTDDGSRNTRENAANSAKLLKTEGRGRVLLVMHAFDVRRAAALFEAMGLTVVAAPTMVPGREDPELADFLPSAAALSTSHFAIYEALALLRDLVVGWVAERPA